MREWDRRTALKGLAAAAGGAAVTGCSDSGTTTTRDPQIGPRVLAGGAVATVRILPGQELVVGQPAYLRFAARDSSEQLIAVPLEEVQVQLLEGEALLQFNEQGQAVGLAAGVVRGLITVGGVSSAVETIIVVATPTPRRKRQGSGEPTVIQVPVNFPAATEDGSTRSARVTLFGAGLDGEDLLAVVDRLTDAPHEVIAVLENCLPGEWDLGVEYFGGLGGVGLLSLLVYDVVLALARSISLGPSDFCFIATELYGWQSPEVRLLRAWRDTCLLPARGGRRLVAAYYATSPHIVRLMRRWRTVRAVAAWFVERVVRRVSAGSPAPCHNSNVPTEVT